MDFAQPRRSRSGPRGRGARHSSTGTARSIRMEFVPRASSVRRDSRVSTECGFPLAPHSWPVDERLRPASRPAVKRTPAPRSGSWGSIHFRYAGTQFRRANHAENPSDDSYRHRRDRWAPRSGRARARSSTGGGAFGCLHSRAGVQLSLSARVEGQPLGLAGRMDREPARRAQRLGGRGAVVEGAAFDRQRRRRRAGAHAAAVFSERQPPRVGAGRRSRRELALAGRRRAESDTPNGQARRRDLGRGIRERKPAQTRAGRRAGDFSRRAASGLPQGAPGLVDSFRRKARGRESGGASLLLPRGGRVARLVSGRKAPRVRVQSRGPQLHRSVLLGKRADPVPRPVGSARLESGLVARRVPHCLSPPAGERRPARNASGRRARSVEHLDGRRRDGRRARGLELAGDARGIPSGNGRRRRARLGRRRPPRLSRGAGRVAPPLLRLGKWRRAAAPDAGAFHGGLDRALSRRPAGRLRRQHRRGCRG